MDHVQLRFRGFVWLLVCVGLQLTGFASTTEGDNAVEFRVLCQVYQAAVLPTESSKPLATAVEKVEEIEREMMFMVEATSENQTNETIQGLPDYKVWLRNNIPSEGARGNGKVANFLKKIQEKVIRHVTSLRELKTAVNRKLSQVKKLFQEARYGDGREAVDSTGVGSFGANYAKACGGTDGTDSPGISLVNDMVCLCTSAQGSQTLDNCGKEFSGVTHSAGVSSAQEAATAWGQMSPFCPERASTLSHERLNKKIDQLVHTFERLIGRNPGNHAHHPFLLGKVTTASSGCVGTSAKQQSCVNYQKRLGAKKENPLTQIPWVNKLAEAGKDLADVQESEDSAKEIVQECQAEFSIAKALYGTVHVGLGEQHGSHQTIQSSRAADPSRDTIGGKEISSTVTTVQHATHHTRHLILISIVYFL